MRALAFAVVATTAGLAAAQPAAPQTAEEHYEASKRFYAVNEFEKAIAELKLAYTMSPDPNYLFNIAQAMRKKGDCVGAIDFYNKYLREAPNAPNRAKVEGWISELDACAKAQPRPVEPKPIDPKPVDSEPTRSKPVAVAKPERPMHRSRLRLAGIVTGGVGGVMLVGGTMLAVSARSIAKGVETSCNGTNGCDWVTERENDQRGHTRATQSRVLFAAGAAAVTGGIVMFVLGKPTRESPVAVVPTESGGMIVGAGRF
jgi:tetratricopeptide (TPR) repeat protein